MIKHLGEERLDKLVIRFSKALDMNLLEERLPVLDDAQPLGGPWLTLGYFDAMQIYPLPECQAEGERNNCFKDIWSHNVKLSEALDGRYYVHPFYIMADLSKASSWKEYVNFWEKKSTYLFVSLTQGARLDGEATLCAEKVEQRVREQLGKQGNRVSCVFYHTLELSDLVIIWKADTVTAVLSQIQALYRQPFIGDLNTFCGIGYAPLRKMCVPQDAPDWSGGLPDASACIPYVAMRFIVKDPEKPGEVFQELKKYGPEPYFVTGTEDLHVIWSNIKEQDFCHMLHHCFLVEQGNQNFRETFRAAFREAETHIGILDTPFAVRSWPKRAAQSQLTKRCQELLGAFGKIVPLARNRRNECDYSWMKAVRNQLNEMLDMSQSYVVDGLCYLTLDSVSLFCDRIQLLLEKSDPLTSKQVEGIQRFVRGWGILVEQAGRADGRFTHLPGFSPPLYDIPSSLLEFYLAFVKQCGQLLQAGGSDMNEFAMLIVPKLCRRIKVETVLNFQKPPCPRILYVDIPLDTLYDPFTVLCVLVHEISHFCGELWRNRESRTSYYLKICAYELATTLGMDTMANIVEILKALREKCKNSSYYLTELKADVHNAMEALIRDDTVFSRWMALCEDNLTFDPEWTKGAWKNWCISNRATLINGYSNGPLYQTIELICELLQECYADVSMIRTLELDFADYLTLAANEIRLYEKWMKTGTDEEIDPGNFYMIVQRWTSVCLAVFGEPSVWKRPDEENLREFFQHMLNCAEYINSDEAQVSDSQWDKYDLNVESLQQLISYLSLCDSNMRSGFPVDDDMKKRLDELQTAFQSAARNHTIQHGCCRSLVSDYESRLLRK